MSYCLDRESCRFPLDHNDLLAADEDEHVKSKQLGYREEFRTLADSILRDNAVLPPANVDEGLQVYCLLKRTINALL